MSIRTERVAGEIQQALARALQSDFDGLSDGLITVTKVRAGDELKPVEGPLTGNTYVITGTLEKFTRDEAAAELEGKGAKVVNSVSGKTTGLIVGEEPGNSKLTKARKLEVPLLTEQELVKLLRG